MDARASACLLAACLVLTVAPASAQQDDLTLPPSADVDRPGAARLEPPREDRTRELEEVIVVGAPEWRLPDLGSAWRQREAEAADTGRIEMRFLPLYDPENEDPTVDMFPRRLETQRIGFIELFRLRFGRRPE